MNDLPSCVENGHITMYADDTSASNSIKSCNDIKVNVIRNLISICDWLKVIKTEFMLMVPRITIENSITSCY